jgi:hypothetical protein
MEADMLKLLSLSTALVSAALLATPPAFAQAADSSSSPAAPSTNAPASGSADTTRRVDTPPKTPDGKKNRNAGVIETDEGRTAGDTSDRTPEDDAKISDAVIEGAVTEAEQNASTTTAVGGTKPSGVQTPNAQKPSKQPNKQPARKDAAPDGRPSPVVP